MRATDDQIAALRASGLSYSEIGARLGITKDAAQKRHIRSARSTGNVGTDDLGAARRNGHHVPPAALPGTRRAGPVDPPYIGFRTAYFDLETTDLKGNFGRLLCGSISDEWGNVTTFDRTQFAARTKIDDRDLALAIRDALEQYDIIVGWNSKLFDVPFLNARLARAGERELNTSIKHVDLMWYATGRFIRAGSRRLDNIAKFFNCENQKTPLVAETWALAAAGDDDALGGIIEHCEADVLVLRDVFDRLKRFIPGVHR